MSRSWPSGALAAGSWMALAGLSAAIARGRTRAVDHRWSRRLSGRRRDGERVVLLAKPKSVALEAAALALWPGLRPRQRAVIGLAPLLAGLAGHLLKQWVPRRRPGLAGLGANGCESFPSTHTAGLGALALAAAQTARARGASHWASGLAGAVILAVAADRIHTRAHWPSDVLAGAVLGLASASAAGMCLAPAGRHASTGAGP
jgi:membrane-associated phospholipid phosphatase